MLAIFVGLASWVVLGLIAWLVVGWWTS